MKDRLDLDALSRHAALADKIINMFERDAKGMDDILPTLSMAIASSAHTISELDHRTCSHAQVLLSMDLIMYCHKHLMDAKRDDDKGTGFMRELRRKGPSGPIDL